MNCEFDLGGGRVPDLDDMDLGRGEVPHEKRGVTVNEYPKKRLLALAIRRGLTAADLKNTVHAYPTHA